MNDIKTTDTTKEYKALVEKIADRIEQGVAKAVTEVKRSQLATYWDNGKYIVEFEQQGKKHAEYGMNLLKSLAGDLTLRMFRTCKQGCCNRKATGCHKGCLYT